MQVNGDAIIQRLAQRIGQLIAENEMLMQRLIELQNKEANEDELQRHDTEPEPATMD